MLLEVSLKERPMGKDVGPQRTRMGRAVYPAREPRSRAYFVARRAARFGAGASPELAAPPV